MEPQQKVTDVQLSAEQLELLPLLVEGAEPDAYLVIPVGLLSRQVEISALATMRAHRGELRPGKFAVHLMRSLIQVGALVDTKYGSADANSTDPTSEHAAVR